MKIQRDIEGYPTTIDVTCSTCMFCVKNPNGILFCYRYPDYCTTTRDGWCGEHPELSGLKIEGRIVG